VSGWSVSGYQLICGGGPKTERTASHIRVVLSQCAAFRNADANTLTAVCAQVSCRRYESGAWIVREGDSPADECFIVDDGELAVEDAAHGLLRTLRSRGELFGERALLSSASGSNVSKRRRSASVRVASSSASVLVFDSGAFDAFLRDYLLSRAEVVAFFTADVPLFAALPEYTRVFLAQHCSEECFADGESVVAQEDSGQDWFVIIDGEARVVKTLPGGKDLEVARLEKGQYFGELAVLHGAPRAASVYACNGSLFVFRFQARWLEMVQPFAKEMMQKKLQHYKEMESAVEEERL
jgi:cAMP-dependent protein kinase regulator